MLSSCSNNIDWAGTGAMLQGIGAIAGVLAAIAVALLGANAWKQQKKAERRLEMAERILTATHKARSALAFVRGPMMWAHELHASEEKLKEGNGWLAQTEGRRKRLITAQAFYNRLNRTKDEQIALDECLPMARALFSDTLEKAIEKLRRQFWIVQVDVDAYIDDENGDDGDFSKKIRRGMYDIKPNNGEKNEISDAIVEAVRVIEASCEPALRLERV